MKPALFFTISLIFTCTAPFATFGAEEGSRMGILESHPVSIVEADIYVNRKKTTMKLKCFAEDLELLQGVVANEETGMYDDIELMDATVDHGKYLAEKIMLLNAKGEKMKPRLAETIDIEFPDEGISAGTLMNYTIGFIFEYTYDSEPEFITVQQEMVADGALFPSELKILLKQAGSDAPYSKMIKPSLPETFRFDWTNILSNDATDEEWESWFEEQREKTLGITSYSSVYSFIYITRHEVRNEVLIPLATLATFLDIERREEGFLDVDEQDAAAEKVKAFFSAGNPVTIDGVSVSPIFDRVDFYGLDLRDFAVQAEKRKISMASGRVGVIMSYSTKGAPKEVTVTWDLFNEIMRSVDTVVFAYDEIEKTQFSKFLSDNTYEWTAPDLPPLPPITDVASSIDLEIYERPTITIPMVTATLVGLGLLCALFGKLFGLQFKQSVFCGASIAVIGAGCFKLFPMEFPHPTQEREQFVMESKVAEQTFSQLHKNMFRAFDYRDETDIYDALAISVDGELLRELYLQVNESLKVKEQGGAVAKINEVNLLEGEKSDVVFSETVEDETPSFDYRCKWNLVGTIEHWGHIHQRTNVYDARFRVQIRDNSWKITQMEVLDELQGQVETSLRRLDDKKPDSTPTAQQQEADKSAEQIAS